MTIKMILSPHNIDIQRMIKEQPNRIRTGVRKAFYKIGKNWVKYLKEEINNTSTKTGKIYYFRKGKRSDVGPSFRVKKVTASAAGEFPANRTGQLKRSLSFLVVGANKMTFGSSAPYAGYLQEGTKRMDPRSLILETINNNEADNQKYLNDEVAAELARQ